MHQACAVRSAVGYLAVLAATIVAAGTGIASGQTGSAAGTLPLRVSLPLVSELGVCPPGINGDACAARTGVGSFPGLGKVSLAYTWGFRMGAPACPADLGKPIATTGRLVVAGKGELHFASPDGARCIEREPLRNEPQAFTITGGTGAYEGASGSGTLERSVSAGRGTETWIGTLVVPGAKFDLTPPKLSGATPRSVTAPKGIKRVRVSYRVTGNDETDGGVAVTCAPRSGSRFRIGRTVVTCSAVDSSANTTSARFVVAVKPKR